MGIKAAGRSLGWRVMSHRRGGLGPELPVVIVSDQEIARAGISAVLRPFRDRVRVVGEVNRIDDAFGAEQESGTQLVLFDARLSGGDGLDAIARLTNARRGRRIVVLARPDEARFMLPVLQHGAAGFLLMSIGGAELADDLEKASDGAIVVDSTLAGGHPSVTRGRGLDDRESTPPLWPGSHLGLTEKESQVLELLALGYRTTRIARHVGMTQLEVKRELRSAYRRLEVQDRATALARLARDGLFC